MLYRLLGRIEIGQHPVQRNRQCLAEGMQLLHNFLQRSGFGFRRIRKTQIPFLWNQGHNSGLLVCDSFGIHFRNTKLLFFGCSGFNGNGAAKMKIRVVFPVVHLGLINGQLFAVLLDHAGPAGVTGRWRIRSAKDRRRHHKYQNEHDQGAMCFHLASPRPVASTAFLAVRVIPSQSPLLAEPSGTSQDPPTQATFFSDK